MYRNDITVEQRQYLLQAIEFVRLAARRARERAELRDELRDEQWAMAMSWGEAMEAQYADERYAA